MLESLVQKHKQEKRALKDVITTLRNQQKLVKSAAASKEESKMFPHTDKKVKK